jgi:hypothetical protein
METHRHSTGSRFNVVFKQKDTTLAFSIIIHFNISYVNNNP